MAASSFPLFINTNLGTQFATLVSDGDTAADLKGKIRTDHALCFPEFGEVSVQAMKVRRKGSFYHLSDSMPVKSSFVGLKGTWFLHLDLVSTTSIKKIQTEATRNISSESCRENLYLTQTERNANPSPQNNEEGFVMYDFPYDKGQIPSECPTVHETRTLPHTLSQKLATQGDSSLPNTGSCQPLILQSSDQFVSMDKDIGATVHLNVQEDNLNDNSGRPPSKLDKRSDPAPLELKDPVNGGNAVIGSLFQQRKELIVDQVKKDDKEEDHPIVGANDVGNSPIASKNKKSRKKGSTLQNDQVLESQFQHPSMDKKKRKRKKDGSLEEFSKDQVTGHNFDTGAHSKMISDPGTLLSKTSPQEKHENNLASSEALPSEPSYVDSFHLNPVEDGQKKKKKKRLSKLNDELPQSIVADPSVTMTNADTEKQKQDAEGNAEEDLVTKNPDREQQIDAADLISKGTEKVIDGSNVEVSMTKPSSATHTGSDYDKETLSKSTITSKNIPSQEVANVNHEGPVHGSSVGLQRESSGTVISKEAEHVRDRPEVSADLPADSRPIKKKRKSVKHVSSKTETLYSSVEDVIGENVEAPGNNYNNLNREPDPVTTAEDMESRNPSNRGSKVFTDIGAGSSHQDTRNKGDTIEDRRNKGDTIELPNPLTNTSEIVDSSAGRATLENPNETSGSHLGHAGKESEGNLIITSKPNDKKPKRSQKRRGKPELPESVVPETLHSFVKEDGEENIIQPSKGISIGVSHADHGQQEKEGKVEALSGEVVANVISATFDSTIQKSKDKKSKRSRKKSVKAELLEPLMSEAAPLKDDAKEDPKEPLGDIVDGTSGGDFGHLGKESKGTTVSGEVADNVDSTIVVPMAPSRPNDKKSKHKSKKTVRSGFPNQESLKEANKVAEENQEVTLDVTNKGSGQESSITVHTTEGTPLKRTAELDSIDTSNAKRKSLRHDKKKTTKGEFVNPSPINNKPNTSSENEHTHVNPEKVGTTNVISECVSDAGINPDGTAQHLEYPELSNKNPAELFNELSDNKTAEISAEKVDEKHTMGLSGKTLEESGNGTVHDMILQGSAELIETNDSQPVPVKEIASRKRKPFLPPLGTTHDLLTPSVSDEQHKSSNTNLVNPSVRLASEEFKTNEAPKRKTVKKAHKSDIRSRNASSVLVSPSKLLDDRAAKKHQESNSHRQVSASMGEKTNHVKAKNNSTNTGTKLQVSAGNESINAVDATDEASLSKNSDSFVRSGNVGASITQKHSSADANASRKETSDNFSASSDSTGEASELKGKQYRVAVRKVPSSRYRKEANKSTQKDISLGTPANIFDDSTSGSSEDEFEINHRRTTVKAGLDNSSTSADSDGDLEETQTTSSYKTQEYMNSPEDGSIAYHETDREVDGGSIIRPRASNARKKVRPLQMILGKNTTVNDFTASQSEVGDSESQPPECVMETQEE
ncbi:uncharacterized protein M6B38_353705 [Iris pallida]|uniref:Uncharacterized protein n=1 Tax=Iris pallida TaxID=29817 RepID=A0AAX6GPP4_IRIPA|nr:uncharacterized protein M6B38_353705 [Iris pallida]